MLLSTLLYHFLSHFIRMMTDGKRKAASARARKRARKRARDKQLREDERAILEAVNQRDVDEQGQATSALVIAAHDDTLPQTGHEVPAGNTFQDVFERFALRAQGQSRVIGWQNLVRKASEQGTEAVEGADDGKRRDDVSSVDADSGHDDINDPFSAGQRLSKRQRRKLLRLSVAELKQLVAHPEFVEPEDATASDPKLLIALKTRKFSVPVPRHWRNKGKYLQTKRGIEKTIFQLPQNIADTGIAELRGEEQAEQQKVAQSARARMQPKMGRMDIDYQVLHDAFFRYQKRPADLTGHGEVYYQGREHDLGNVSREKATPGVISAELAAALGMNDPKRSPPPWLFAMQRYGPPPAYPDIKLPGVTAPIPQGSLYGFAEGQWGAPAVDAFGRPRFGDVFGTAANSGGDDQTDDAGAKAADTTFLWGAIAADEEISESEDENEADGAIYNVEALKREGGIGEVPIDLVSGTASTLAGMATPAHVPLRKGVETPVVVAASAPRNLYTVLKQTSVPVDPKSLLGTDKAYILPPS